MYEKYRTDALVLAAYSRGEADKYFTLYTREFGLVRARATSVRLERSKMRYSLQSLSRVIVSLVRGKSGWRITGAEAVQGGSIHNIESLQTFARIGMLLQRLLHGEEKNDYLFDALREVHGALAREGSDTQNDLELLSVVRILYALGYLAPNDKTRPLVETTHCSDVELSMVSMYRPLALETVNAALAATHL